MFEFANVTDITIPEGAVFKIEDSTGVILWRRNGEYYATQDVKSPDTYIEFVYPEGPTSNFGQHDYGEGSLPYSISDIVIKRIGSTNNSNIVERVVCDLIPKGATVHSTATGLAYCYGSNTPIECNVRPQPDQHAVDYVGISVTDLVGANFEGAYEAEWNYRDYEGSVRNTKHTLTYKHVDTTGATILADSIVSNIDYGTPYNIYTSGAPSIDGYVISRVEGDLDDYGRIYVTEDTVVTYVYRVDYDYDGTVTATAGQTSIDLLPSNFTATTSSTCRWELSLNHQPEDMDVIISASGNEEGGTATLRAGTVIDVDVNWKIADSVRGITISCNEADGQFAGVYSWGIQMLN